MVRVDGGTCRDGGDRSIWFGESKSFDETRVSPNVRFCSVFLHRFPRLPRQTIPFEDKEIGRSFR